MRPGTWASISFLICFPTNSLKWRVVVSMICKKNTFRHLPRRSRTSLFLSLTGENICGHQLVKVGVPHAGLSPWLLLLKECTISNMAARLDYQSSSWLTAPLPTTVAEEAISDKHSNTSTMSVDWWDILIILTEKHSASASSVPAKLRLRLQIFMTNVMGSMLFIMALSLPSLIVLTSKIMVKVSSTMNAARYPTTQWLLSAGVSNFQMKPNTGSSVTPGDINLVRMDISELRSMENAKSIS